MKKFLIVVISLIISLAVMLTGCVTTVNPATSTDSSSSTSSGGSSADSSVPSDVPDTAYTVTLVLPDGVTAMPDLTGIQAKWTNSTSVYTADFDSSGFAYYDGLDGEYSVTISGLIDGYSYNPNIYDTSSGKDVSIQLLTLQTFAGQKGYSIGNEGRAIAYGTDGIAVYRIEYTSANQTFYFMFLPNLTTTGYTYSIQTYADVTENEICPTFYLYNYSNYGLRATINGGSDYNGSYTKNIYYELDMSSYSPTSSFNLFIYAFSIKSTNNDYPKYLDIVITREAEYVDTSQDAYPQAELDETQVKAYDSSVTDGTRTWVVDIVKDEYNYDFTGITTKQGDDGYYYIEYNGQEYMLFVELDGCHLGAYSTRYNYYGPFSSDTLCDINGGIRYDDVIDAYIANAETYGTSGYHPVTKQLKEFLRNYAAHRLFNDTDGTTTYAGWLEEAGYSSNEANQWLYACCFYV